MIKLGFFAKKQTANYTLACEFDMNIVANFNATVQSAKASSGSPTIMAYLNVTTIKIKSGIDNATMNVTNPANNAVFTSGPKTITGTLSDPSNVVTTVAICVQKVTGGGADCANAAKGGTVSRNYNFAGPAQYMVWIQVSDGTSTNTSSKVTYNVT